MWAMRKVRSKVLLAAAGMVCVTSCSVVNAPEDPVPAHGMGGQTGQGGETGGIGGAGGQTDCEGPLKTLENCGECGNACEPANVQGATCSTGTCNYGTCQAGFDDCDSDRTNGCEIETTTDPAHCGACQSPCSATLQNVAAALCAQSECDYTTCDPLFGDCDNDRTNGCELPTNTLTDCGACDTPCQPAFATGATCASGTCNYGQCEPMRGDCDNDPATGCEADLLLDEANCGHCQNACAGNQTCFGGHCLRPNLMLCGPSERDVMTFVPATANLTLVSVSTNCSPDGATQAILISRDGVGQYNPQALQSYVDAGGIVLTEYGGSYAVFTSLFSPVSQPLDSFGNCDDLPPTVVKHTANDPFWTDNLFTQLPLDQSGCGYPVQDFPGVTPLFGWDGTNAAGGYRDRGQGRLWLTDWDWQDQDVTYPQWAKDLVFYMITHRRPNGSQ
jgi:hypothetical protein